MKHQAYISKSENVQQHNQLRTGKNQWDPGTHTCLEKSGQKWTVKQL